MIDKQNSNQDQDISFEERFKLFERKVRPYVKNIKVSRKNLFIFNGVVLALTLVILLFLVKPYYTSTVTILPDYGSKETSLGQLSSLASLAGVNVGTSSPTEIYQNLIMSESVLTPVIYEKYKTKKYPDSVNLIQYYEIEPDDDLSLELQKRDMFLKEFKDLTMNRLSVEMDRLTKILTITTTMTDAQLSANVANNIAESLDNYIRTKRKSYASEQRKYIEKRLFQVKDSLNIAENNLMNFREQNRTVSQSPALTLEQTRLSRSAEILSSVYLELSKQYELVKIDEVKDTPVLNIKEPAMNPVIKSGPKRLQILIIIMILSVLFSMLYYSFKDNIKKYYGYIKEG